MLDDKCVYFLGTCSLSLASWPRQADLAFWFCIDVTHMLYERVFHHTCVYFQCSLIHLRMLQDTKMKKPQRVKVEITEGAKQKAKIMDAVKSTEKLGNDCDAWRKTAEARHNASPTNHTHTLTPDLQPARLLNSPHPCSGVSPYGFLMYCNYVYI